MPRSFSNISAEWPDVALGDLVDIKHGFAFQGEFFRDDPPGDVLLTPGNFAIGGGFKGDKLKYYAGPVPEEYVLSAGDLIVTMTDLSKQGDTLGYPAIVPTGSDRFLHNQRIGKVLSVGERAETRFLYYLLCTREYRNEVLASATGTTVKHTAPSRIRAFRLALPPLTIQRGIAEVLRALDDKIELNRRMNQTLESMARAIFRSWFVDFDPPEGNATRIGDMVRRGYLEVGDGYRAKNSELSSSGLPFARAGNLKAGFDFSGADCFPAERISAVGAKVSRPGDVVFTSKGTVGRLAYVHVSTPQFVYSPQLCYWRVIDPVVIDSRWLYRWMQFGDFRDQCDEVKGQTDMADYVSLRDQQTMCLSLPDIGIQRGLGDVLGSLGERVELNRRMNGTLAALHDTLLPKLMSGELRVRDAEKLAATHV